MSRCPRDERNAEAIVEIQTCLAYSIARKLAFTKPFFIAKLLINQSFDFLHHTRQANPSRSMLNPESRVWPQRSYPTDRSGRSYGWHLPKGLCHFLLFLLSFELWFFSQSSDKVSEIIFKRFSSDKAKILITFGWTMTSPEYLYSIAFKLVITGKLCDVIVATQPGLSVLEILIPYLCSQSPSSLLFTHRSISFSGSDEFNDIQRDFSSCWNMYRQAMGAGWFRTNKHECGFLSKANAEPKEEPCHTWCGEEVVVDKRGTRS